jgi:hypothetical protein
MSGLAGLQRIALSRLAIGPVRSAKVSIIAFAGENYVGRSQSGEWLKSFLGGVVPVEKTKMSIPKFDCFSNL